MDRDTFWKIIDDARESVDYLYDVASYITERLAKLTPEEIVAFKQYQWDVEAESYRWDLWAVAYIVNGGCSDDGFDYFRGWLMANGRKRFEAAMANPESIADWAEGDADYEDMLYVAIDAYKQKTGKEFPYDSVTSKRPTDPVGEEWEVEQLETMYPGLWKKFC
jgi:hypothetical protein